MVNLGTRTHDRDWPVTPLRSFVAAIAIMSMLVPLGGSVGCADRRDVQGSGEGAADRSGGNGVSVHGSPRDIRALRITYAKLGRLFRAGHGAAVCRRLGTLGRATVDSGKSRYSCGRYVAARSAYASSLRRGTPEIVRIAVYRQAGVAGITILADGQRYRVPFISEHGRWLARPNLDAYPLALVAR